MARTMRTNRPKVLCADRNRAATATKRRYTRRTAKPVPGPHQHPNDSKAKKEHPKLSQPPAK